MSVPPEYQHIFGLFSKVRECRGYWKICCPGHSDVHPSATVRIGREGLLFRCFSHHCSFRQIMAGLATRAGRPLCCRPWNGEKDGTRKPRRIKPMAITQVYPYQDEGGEILYEKCRIEPGAQGRKKDFMARRPNPDYDSVRKLGEEWIWNLEGCRRVLYGLPDLIEALKGQESLPQEKRRTTFLMEGEKDAETAWSLGLIATTGDGGARNLHLTETDPLMGSNVVIPFDRDLPDDRTRTVPGMEHALQAVNILTSKGCRVQLLRLPGGPGDFTDWVDTFPVKGRTDAVRGELRQLLRAAPAWTMWGPEIVETAAQGSRPFYQLIDQELGCLRADGIRITRTAEIFGEVILDLEAIKIELARAKAKGEKPVGVDVAKRFAKLGAWLLAATEDLKLLEDSGC